MNLKTPPGLRLDLPLSRGGKTTETRVVASSLTSVEGRVRAKREGWGILFITLLFFLWCGQADAAVLSKAPNNLGLVGYWAMNEGRGNLVGDSSGFGNHATTTNMSDTNWVVGKLGKGLDFSGSSDYASAGVITELSGATKATLAGWLYRPNTSTSVGFGQHVEPYRFAMLWYSGGQVYSEAENGTASYPSFSNNQTGWHHYVMVYDGTLSGLSRINVYWDGVLQSLTIGGSDPAAALPSGANQTDFRFGMDDPIATVRDWDGRLDEVRIYNRALTASEVAALYQSGAVKLAASSADLDNNSTLGQGLVGHWTLDGVDTNWGSNTTLDRSGSGNTGTMTSMSTTTSPAPGKIGQGLLFSASGSRIGMGDVSSLKPTSAVSFSGWVNLKDNVACNVGNRGIFTSGMVGTSGFDVGFTTTCVLRARVNGTQSISPAALERGRWYFISATWDGSVTRLYVDGAQVDNDNAASITYGSESVLLGNTNFSNQSLYGTLDDARLYNRALSANEVKQLYNLGQGKLNASQNKTGGSLDSGLVGLWSFNGPDISWGSNTAYDRSGQGNNGTITNMSTTTSPTPGKIGQALKFDGSNDYVNVSDHSSLDLSGSLSASFWINPKDYGYLVATEKYGRVLRKGVNYDILIGDNTPDCVAGVSVSGTLTSTYCIPNAVTLNEWQHFVVVQTGSIFTLYKNGSLFGTATANIGSTNTTSLVIGNYDNVGSTPRYFNGSIDELRLYNRVLSANEVKQLYNFGR